MGSATSSLTALALSLSSGIWKVALAYPPCSAWGELTVTWAEAAVAVRPTTSRAVPVTRLMRRRDMRNLSEGDDASGVRRSGQCTVTFWSSTSSSKSEVRIRTSSCQRPDFGRTTWRSSKWPGSLWRMSDE